MDLRALRPVDDAAARDAELRRWRQRFPDVSAIADLVDRHPGICVGVVTAIRLVPRRSLQIRVEDGSGRLVATWMGRTALPGLELGGAFRLSGTVSHDADGTRRMRNPGWAPVVEPYT